MLNVEQITNRLAQMPDQALQKYAALHKNDPYIMALAVSESNRRKQMRNAAQGAQGMQEPPKVVDQEVQGMAAPMPEDMGIARIPAGNMNFADGGIVAFAGGGDVEHYQYGGTTARNPLAILNPGDFFSGVGRVFNEGVDPVAAEQRRQDALRKLVAPAEETVGTPEFAAAQQALKDKAKAEGRTLPGETPPAAATTPAAPTAKAAAGQAAAPAGGFASLLKAVESPVSAGAQRSPYASDIEKLNAARVAQSESEAQQIEALNAKFADAYKGREERLSKRESELSGLKDQSLGIALLQAGAAMMSTPGSFGTAVGKGLEAGSRQYIAGMEKVNAAKEKLADARDRLDDLKLNRDEMSAREILKAKSAIKQQENAGLELLLRADMEENKVSREEALKRLDMRTRIGIAQLQEQSASARAAAAASSPERVTFNSLLVKHKGDAAAAYAEMASMKREPVSLEKMRAEWNDMGKRMAIQSGDPTIKTFDDYVASQGGARGGAGGFKYLGVSQ